MRQARKARLGIRLPPELINIVGTAGAILAVVATGSAVVAAMPGASAWQSAAAYAAPGALAFAIYWWIARSLR